MWWHVTLYLIDLIAMVSLSFFLGSLVDEVDKRTKISGAFLGGVLLAAITSLPELFTALSSIFFVNEPEYVVGDIYGSILFDLVILAVETLFFVKSFRQSKLSKFHFLNGVICLIMYLLSAYAFFAPVSAQVMLGDINLISILIFGLYIFSLFLQPKEKEAEETTEEKHSKLDRFSISTIWVLFALSSVALIGTSVALTYLTKFLQNDFPVLTGSVAGAILLGIGTSIPELISTFQLFKKKNFDAGFGNIIGSCTFDFAIFALSDFLSWRAWSDAPSTNGGYLISERGLFLATKDAYLFEIFGIVTTLSLLLFLLLKQKTDLFSNPKKKKWSYVTTMLWALLSTGFYLAVFL